MCRICGDEFQPIKRWRRDDGRMEVEANKWVKTKRNGKSHGRWLVISMLLFLVPFRICHCRHTTANLIYCTNDNRSEWLLCGRTPYFVTKIAWKKERNERRRKKEYILRFFCRISSVHTAKRNKTPIYCRNNRFRVLHCIPFSNWICSFLPCCAFRCYTAISIHIIIHFAFNIEFFHAI